MNDALGSMWDHIDDLRATLIRILMVVGIGFIVVLMFYQPLFSMLTYAYTKQTSQAPFKKEIYQHERVFNNSSHAIVYHIPKEANILRWSSGVTAIKVDQFKIEPNQFLDYETPLSQTNELFVLGPLDGINLVFKVCFWMSFALTSPIWVYFLLQFVLPGLKREEQGIIMPFVVCTFACLTMGLLTAYFVTIPIANSYLQSFNADIGKNLWSLTQYVDYTLVLLLGHAVAFELSLILFFLVHFRIVSPEWLARKRRHMIVAAFIVGALLTPPDVPTQLMLAIPLIGIYELVILYGKMRSLKLTTYANVN